MLVKTVVKVKAEIHQTGVIFAKRRNLEIQLITKHARKGRNVTKWILRETEKKLLLVKVLTPRK